MTAMTEPTEHTDLHGPAEPESATVAVADQTRLIEAFENTVKVSQDVGQTDCAASEETDTKEKLDQEDRQQDGQTVPPPAAESCSTESKWEVGAQCRAVWSEDGQLYPAKVVSVDGQRCRVCFNGYANVEDVELSALKSPDCPQNSEDWRPGSRCRAVYSEDGLVYPALVLWVKGQHCRVRFDDYNNEEDQDVSSLLNPDELHGPSRAAAAAKGSSRKSSVTSNSDCRRRREENQGERGGEGRWAWRDDQQNSSWQVKDRPTHHSNEEKETDEKKKGKEKPTNRSSPLFPPFPPPQSSSGDPVSSVPPPPLWMSGGIGSASSMLMLWYMCGFHTGSYMAQQEFKSSSKR